MYDVTGNEVVLFEGPRGIKSYSIPESSSGSLYPGLSCNNSSDIFTPDGTTNDLFSLAYHSHPMNIIFCTGRAAGKYLNQGILMINGMAGLTDLHYPEEFISGCLRQGLREEKK